MDKKTEKFWRDQLEGLRGPVPEIGDDPPSEESDTLVIDEDDDFSETNGINPASVGNLSVVTMDVYFFMNIEDNRYFMMQTQTMNNHGEMSLKKAIEKVARKKRRK